MPSRKTAPKPRQVTKSEIVRDDFFDSSQIENLEDELNYIRSQIRGIKGTNNFDDVVSDSLQEIADRIGNQEGFVYIQNTPSAIWTITHSLGRYPNLIIFDAEFNQIFAKTKMLNINTTRITFSEPIVGLAVLK
jgi:hypothetical protein